MAYWLCFCNGKPLVYRVLYEAPLRTQSPLTNSLPISNLISKIRYLLQKYRHTRNLLETRVIIKIWPILAVLQMLTYFHGNEAKKNYLQNFFKNGSLKKTEIFKTTDSQKFFVTISEIGRSLG